MEMIQRWTGGDACRLQAALRMSHEAFAARLGVAPRTVAGWHERAHTVPRHEIQAALDVLLERAADGVLARFHTPAPVAPVAAPGVRSHKFVTAYPGPQVTAVLARGGRPCPDLLGGHAVAPARHLTGAVDLHVWRHGVVIAHVVEEPGCASLTELAQWRYASYPRDLAWLTGVLDTPAEYVLSAYWLDVTGWDQTAADRVVRVVCIPRVLCGDGDRVAPEVEARVLAEGFDDPGLTPFGAHDAAIGYASWSGVAYAPLDPARALPESALVDLELSLQAVWTYASWITGQVEQGRDPAIPAEHGWRWLRGARSRLVTPRPQETSPHRSMRDAIVSTSGLPGMVGDAISALRETEMGPLADGRRTE